MINKSGNKGENNLILRIFFFNYHLRKGIREGKKSALRVLREIGHIWSMA